jgi:glutaryl-CoA dehydrogenase
MSTRIGRARGTDYLLIREQLTAEEIDYLDRTRQFVDNEVLPVIGDYWERHEVPFPLIEKMAGPRHHRRRHGRLRHGVDGPHLRGVDPHGTASR